MEIISEWTLKLNSFAIWPYQLAPSNMRCHAAVNRLKRTLVLYVENDRNASSLDLGNKEQR